MTFILAKSLPIRRLKKTLPNVARVIERALSIVVHSAQCTPFRLFLVIETCVFFSQVGFPNSSRYFQFILISLLEMIGIGTLMHTLNRECDLEERFRAKYTVRSP